MRGTFVELDAEEQAQLTASYKNARDEDAFWAEHGRALATKFPGRFVAIHDGCPIAVSDDLLDLVALIEAKGLTARDTWIRFLTTDPARLIV